MIRKLLQCVGVSFAIAISAGAWAAPFAFLDPNDTTGTVVKFNIQGREESPNCNPTDIQPRKLINGSFSDFGSNALIVWNAELRMVIESGGTYEFRIRYCSGFRPDGRPLYTTDTTNTLIVPGIALPPPTTPPKPTANQSQTNPVDYTISWGVPAANTYYRISERSQTLDDWQVDTGDNWGNWSTFVTTAPVQNPPNSTATSQAYQDKQPAVYQYKVIACNNDNVCSPEVPSDAVIVQTPQFDSGQTYQMQGAKIRAIWTSSPEGCYVLFEELPNACEGNFNNAHALIPIENPNHEKMYSQAFIANALGQTIDVWFDDNGDCNTREELMTIGRIETEDIRQNAGGQN